MHSNGFDENLDVKIETAHFFLLLTCAMNKFIGLNGIRNNDAGEKRAVE